MMSKFIPNSFQIPNAVIDELMAEMSGAELKCYLAILRKTKGWNKDCDAISVTQLMEITGLSNRAVINACKSLVEMGLLDLKNGSRNVNVFTPNWCKKFTSEKKSLVKKVHSTSEKSSLDLVKKVHTQNNNKKHYLKDNNNISPQPTAVVGVQGKNEILEFALENNVDEKLAQEFIQYRKSKKAPLTETAIKRIALQAEKAKLPLSEVLGLMMERGWQGFKADWVLPERTQSTVEAQTNLDTEAVIHAYNEILGDRLVPLDEDDQDAPLQILALLPKLEKKNVEAFKAYFQAFANNAQEYYFEPHRKFGFSFLMKPETLMKTRRGEI